MLWLLNTGLSVQTVQYNSQPAKIAGQVYTSGVARNCILGRPVQKWVGL